MEFSRLLGRRRLPLAQFELPPLEFEELAELILQEPLESGDPGSNVVQLSWATPTAGELRDSIERHLQSKGGDGAADRAVSPADELKSALAELRSSLR